MEKNLIELFALWENTSKKGSVYYSGNLGNARVMMFENNSDNPRAPKYKVCLAPKMDREEQAAEAHDEAKRNAYQPDMSRQDNGPKDDDIPF